MYYTIGAKLQTPFFYLRIFDIIELTYALMYSMFNNI